MGSYNSTKRGVEEAARIRIKWRINRARYYQGVRDRMGRSARDEETSTETQSDAMVSEGGTSSLDDVA